MPCYHMKLDDDSTAIVCSRGRGWKHCYYCRKRTTTLCDFPAGTGKTCDRAICSDCGERMGPDLDHCKIHKEESNASSCNTPVVPEDASPCKVVRIIRTRPSADGSGSGSQGKLAPDPVLQGSAPSKPDHVGHVPDNQPRVFRRILFNRPASPKEPGSGHSENKPKPSHHIRRRV
jgi:hypothetical protein